MFCVLPFGVINNNDDDIYGYVSGRRFHRRQHISHVDERDAISRPSRSRYVARTMTNEKKSFPA